MVENKSFYSFEELIDIFEFDVLFIESSTNISGDMSECKMNAGSQFMQLSRIEIFSWVISNRWLF